MYRLVNGDSNLPQLTPAQAHAQARRGEFPPRKGYRDFVPQALRRLINKARNVDPALRYQSAEEMRRALEHQPLLVDWSESVAPTRTTWTGIDIKGVQYEVLKVQQSNRRWSVQTRRGKSAQNLRRIGKLCASELRKQDAEKRARRILQSFAKGPHNL
jgi:serine/threonine protein kinase